jgi:predicted butyrate kinase (DUF1464 family)
MKFQVKRLTVSDLHDNRADKGSGRCPTSDKTCKDVKRELRENVSSEGYSVQIEKLKDLMNI